MPNGDKGSVDLHVSRDTALQAAREAVRDTTRLTRLLSILNDSGPLHLLLDRGLSTLSELFSADVVVLFDPVGTGSFSPLASIGLPEDRACLAFSSQEGSLLKLLLSLGEPINVKDVGSGPEIDAQLLDLGVETLIGLPVNGNRVGPWGSDSSALPACALFRDRCRFAENHGLPDRPDPHRGATRIAIRKNGAKQSCDKPTS